MSERAVTASLAVEGGGSQLDIMSLMLQASGVVLFVLILLILFSVICWYIIGYKYFFLRRAEIETRRFLENFWTSKRLDAIYQTAEQLKRSPISQLFKAGYIELSKIKGSGAKAPAAAGAAATPTGQSTWLGDLESIERALERTQTNELTQLESMTTFLATTGSAAPFIGLFGTVWGIMNSFRSIGEKGAANLATVAPGIAEALVATAIGLAAAIPAVMAFNFFVRRIKVLAAEMDAFSKDFLNIIKRHFFK